MGLRSLCVRAVHPKPKGMHGLLAPFRQLRSLSLHVFIKPDDLRCLRGAPLPLGALAFLPSPSLT